MARFGWARRRRVWLPVAIVLAAVVAVVTLNPGAAVRDAVIGRLSAALGRPVSVGSVQARLLPTPRVALSDLRVGPGGTGPLVELDVARLDLALAWGPLLRRQVGITSLAIVSPRVVVQMPAAGAPPASRAPTASGPPLGVDIRSLTITDGALTVRRADGAALLELAGLTENLTATLARDGDIALKGRTTLDTLRFHTPQGVLGEGLPLAWEKDLGWQGAARRLTIRSSTLSLGDLPVSVSGAVERLGDAAPLADLAFSGGPAPVGSLVGFLPAYLAPRLEGVTSSGQIALAGTLAGTLGAVVAGQPLPFSYDLSFDLTGGRVSAPALPAPLSGLELHLHAHDDVVEISRFAAATPRSRLEAAGTMNALLTSPTVALDLTADVDLAEVMALQPPRPDLPTLRGRFAGTVKVSGPTQPPSALSFDGAGRLHDLAMSSPTLRPAIDRIDGPIRLRGRQLLADGVEYRQGPTDLTITGSIDNFLALVPESKVAPPAVLAAEIEGRLLDADAYAAPPGTAKEAAGPDSGLAKLALIVGHADVTMARLLTRGHELRDVRGGVDLDRGRLQLRDVRGTLYGGQTTLAGSIDLSNPARGTMDLEVRLAGVQAQELSRRAVAMSRFARLGGLVTGLVDGHATLKGALDDTFGLDLMTFSTRGQIEIRQARLAGSPLQKKLAGLLSAPQLESVAVSEWLQPFRIEDGKLHVDGLKLSAAGIGVRAGGWQALDGSMALGVELTVPQKLAAGLRDKLPSAVAAALFDGSDAPLIVPVGMTGRWDDPQLQLDTEALAAAAADRARARVTRQVDQAKQQVDQRLDEAKQQATEQVRDAAGQALGRLLGQPGDTAAAAADTAAAPAVQDQVKSILRGLRGGRGN